MLCNKEGRWKTKSWKRSRSNVDAMKYVTIDRMATRILLILIMRVQLFNFEYWRRHTPGLDSHSLPLTLCGHDVKNIKKMN